MKLKTTAMLALCALGSYAGSASAVAIIQMDDFAGNTGTISYDGLGGGAVGTNIVINTVSGVGTNLNPGVTLNCVSCVLNFVTGSNILEGGSTWEWNNGGSFVVTGTVKDSGGNTVASGVLLSGLFQGGIKPEADKAAGGALLNFDGFGVDTKNADLVAYYGEGTNDWSFVNTVISAGGCKFTAGGAFNCNVTNVDLDNIEQAPEPMSLGLLGLGLLGLGVTRRRKA